jgi:hypothetical protein
MYQLTNSESIIRIEDGAVIPADTLNTDYQNYLAWLAAGNIAQMPVKPALPTIDELRAKMSLTSAQFRINLIKAGYYQKVVDAIALLPVTHEMVILWEYSFQFDRLNPYLIALGVQLGMTAEQMDAVFTL